MNCIFFLYLKVWHMSSVSGPCVTRLIVFKFYGVALLIHYFTHTQSVLTTGQVLG